MKTAAEFFKEKYGHSYITPFDSISTIQFATDYALDILPSQPEVSEGRIEEIWEKHKSYFPSNCQGMTLGGFKKALISLQPAVSEDDIITEIMNNGMAGVFDEDGVVLCYDVNANMAAKAIMELLNKPTKK